MPKWLIMFITLTFSGCSTFKESTRFENIGPSEITNENLPKGSRVVLDLKDGSRKGITIANVSENDVSGTAGFRISKSDIFAITVLSWGDFSSNTSDDTVAGVTTDTGENVIETFGCLLMVFFGGVDFECD